MHDVILWLIFIFPKNLYFLTCGSVSCYKVQARVGKDETNPPPVEGQVHGDLPHLLHAPKVMAATQTSASPRHDLSDHQPGNTENRARNSTYSPVLKPIA